jgi:hypothetical protein
MTQDTYNLHVIGLYENTLDREPCLVINAGTSEILMHLVLSRHTTWRPRAMCK